MKKILFIIISLQYLALNKTFASVPDWIIPTKTWLPWDNIDSSDIVWEVWWNIISTFIQYIAVIAVISLMLSGIMYLLSAWEEEKVKKAKNWIIWSLVWVFLSVFAYSIVWFINNMYISTP